MESEITPSSPEILYYNWNTFHAGLDWISMGRARGKSSARYEGYNSSYVATWVRSGRAYKRIGKQSITAEAGEWVFQQPEHVKSEYELGTQVLEVAYTIRWLGQEPLLFPPLGAWKSGPLPLLEEKSLVFYRTVQQALGMVSTYQMRYRPINMRQFFQFRGWFDDWMVTLEDVWRDSGKSWQAASPDDSKIVMAVKYLETLPMDRPISVTGMAKSLGVSTSQLTRLFQQHCGMAPKEYRMNLKLKQAMRDLQSTDYEIKEIAQRLGCSHVWLINWLRRHTGKTPTQIRAERE